MSNFSNKRWCESIFREIRENVCICCAVTMEPDEVETLIDKLKTTIEEGWNKQ